MRRRTSEPSAEEDLDHFLTPQVWKQAHQAWHAARLPSRWKLKPLLWVLLHLSWASGDSQEERFATARAAYVAAHPRERRPGKTLAGFLQALARLPLPVLRALPAALRQRMAAALAESCRLNGLLPIACDGARLQCPRAEELQRRLGEAGKADSAPMLYLTALVLLPRGLPWAWTWGKGTASEHEHLRALLPTLPGHSLLVLDAGYLGYELFADILRAGPRSWPGCPRVPGCTRSGTRRWSGSAKVRSTTGPTRSASAACRRSGPAWCGSAASTATSGC